jgi:ActR/RegA family two-component response regulator
MEGEMGRSVLLVDDDDLIRVVGARILARAGFRPTVAQTASAALALLDALTFDAAILDYFLIPGQCGCDLIAPLRAHNPAIHVAVLSGLGDLPDVIRHAHRAGADVVASKHHIDWVGLARGESAPAPPPSPAVNIDALKRNAIHGTYLVHHRNMTQTARALGMKRGNLQRILRKQPPPDVAQDE